MTVEANPPTIEADTAYHSPVPASHVSPGPLGNFRAYVTGLEVSRAGEDLAELIFTAQARWGRTTRQICNDQAGASVGWTIAELRKDDGFCPPLVFRILCDAASCLRAADRRLAALEAQSRALQARLAAAEGRDEP
jgi:hypothetical protein